MREVVDQVAAWQDVGTNCAIATIVAASGSTPLPAGTMMAFSAEGSVVGNISSGCVESDLYHIAAEVMQTSVATLRRYSIDDDEAGGLGLMCGGSIEVLVQPADIHALPGIALLQQALAADEPVVVATVITDGPTLGRSMVVTVRSRAGSCGTPPLDESVARQAEHQLGTATTTTFTFGEDGECAESTLTVFTSSIAQPPHLLVIGAVDFAGALVRTGKTLGYKVTVCDARPVFATAARFPEADEIVVEWPHQFLENAAITNNTIICVLTHDPRFDVPVLEVALRSPAGYIGVMGSRRTHDDRMRRLRDAGVTQAELGRLRSPLGLDLGATTPEETAISILAEVIALRRGGTGRPLQDCRGPIHRQHEPHPLVVAVG
ncbi:XdhC family protein [Rhodococcus pyridinivorans]|uniref:XdhC family protein n=1 Tax=Rhodococcus pyridinivorans TaxID=103816 RepID=UPI00110D4D54|nr:XdhC/CoxI family protein [Rhodococcus pyridinivorans]